MPYKNLISEVLSAHADQLLKKQNKSRDYARLFPDNQDLPPLLTLADHVNAALQPVQPPQSFKEQLQRDLMAAARMKQFAREETAQSPSVYQTPLLISAIISALIVLGSLFVFFRWQHQSQQKTLTNNA
jgi:hypothetical protein